MKPNVKVLYYLSKINGLIPFQLNVQQEIVEKTKRSFYHFLVFGAIIQGLSICAYITLYRFFSSFNGNKLRVLVVKWELGVQVFKYFMIFFLTLWHHNDIIKLINESISFKNIITNITPPAPLHDFFDDISISQYIGRSVVFFVQVLMNLSSFMIFIYDPSNILVNLSWTINIYNHFCASIVSSIFFYGGFVISSRFVRILNNHFDYCVSSTRNGQNVDGSSMSTESAIFHLEQFGIFFAKFGSITNKLFHIYGFQILLTLVSSTAFTLSSVRKFAKLKKIVFFYSKQILKLFYVFEIMYGQPNLKETFKNDGPTIINTLSFVVVDISEFFYIVSGAQTITNEVKKVDYTACVQ